jgi:hypothetical protein
MDRVYFVRFRKSKNGQLLPILEKEWFPFYRDSRYPFYESFPERIWTALMSMKMEVQKSLCRGGEWNGRTVSAKLVGISPSFFGYLQEELKNMSHDSLLEDTIRSSKCRKVMFDNLSARQVRSKVETGIIRILEESQLDAVRKVFGVSFGVGVCFPVPSLKMVKANVGLKPTVWLRNMDPVRIVSCLPEECDLEPDKPKPPLVVSNDDDEISSGKKEDG